MKMETLLLEVPNVCHVFYPVVSITCQPMFLILVRVHILNSFSLWLSVVLYQEYSDVAINREIQRQQGAEPGTDEDRSGDYTSPSNLSPSSSFRSSRGSAFSLWQDIPDVRSSGELDNFTNEERKLQEVMLVLYSALSHVIYTGHQKC